MTYPSCEIQAVMELFPFKTLESLDTELQPGGNKLDVGSFSQGVVDDGFVLVYSDRTGGVYYVSARSGVGVARVDSAEEELFLQLSEELEITFRLGFPSTHNSYNEISST